LNPQVTGSFYIKNYKENLSMSEIPKKLEELISGIRIVCNNLEFEEHFWLVLAIREKFILNVYGYKEEFFNKLILISKNDANNDLITQFETLNDMCFSGNNSIYKEQILNRGLPAISDILPPLNKSLIILKNSSNEKWKEIIEVFDYGIVIENLPKLNQIENINFSSVKNDASKFESDFKTIIDSICNEYKDYKSKFPKKSKEFKKKSILESLKYIFTMYLYLLELGNDILIYYPIKITDNSEIVFLSIFKYDNFMDSKKFLIFFWKYIKILSFCVHSQFYSTYLQEVLKKNKDSGVTAILTESYAHNIGAHGLEGLKVHLSQEWENISKNILNENPNESILYLRTKLLNILPSFNTSIKDIIKTHSNFIEYISYLQGKSAFWSAISRGEAPLGGKIMNMWELINDFAKNNLLCGSLGDTEGYKGIEFYVKVNSDDYISLGASTIEDDLRFRFEEEELLGSEADQLKNYNCRTGQQINNESTLKALKDSLEKMEIFLPGEIVSQQAVYTIWENIIRNVKHCVKPETGNFPLIPFYIEIRENEIHYEITTWLDLNSKKTNEIQKKVNEMQNWKGILTEDNRPNMGGISQNILCAGLIFGLDFVETERKQKDNKDILKIKVKKTNREERISYTFNIWKGKQKETWENITKLAGNGPLGRFKIIVVKNENEKEEFLEKSASIRYVIDNNGRQYQELYEDWIKIFILKKNIYPEGIYVEIPIEGIQTLYLCTSKGIQEHANRTYSNIPYIRFHHGNHQNRETEIDFKWDSFIGNIIYKANKEREKLLELIEIVGTKIDIFDNRLFNLFSGLSAKEKERLIDLGVNVYEENNLNENNLLKHFLIIHQSFVESLTDQKDEKAIEKFWETEQGFCKKYDFIIITTGRGRIQISKLNKEIRKKVRFIPIENLEKCFEIGKNLEPKAPSIGIKYALVKTLFGS